MLEAWKSLKNEYGVELLMYEGGFGLYGGNDLSLPAKEVIADAVHTNRRMANLYYTIWTKAQEAGYSNVMIESFAARHFVSEEKFGINSIYWGPNQKAGLEPGDSPSDCAHVVCA